MEHKGLLELASAMPPVETERLFLTRITVSDAREMYDYARLEKVTRFLLWSPHPSIRHTRRYIRLLEEKYDSREFFDWGVHLKKDGAFIGTCGFALLDPQTRVGEIGYVFSPKAWGHGYATEAASAVIRYGFTVLDLNKITARYMLGNLASERVMQKLGMHSVGFLPQQLYVKEEYRSVLQYELTKEEYLSTAK